MFSLIQNSGHLGSSGKLVLIASLRLQSVCWYHIQIIFVKSSVADIGYLASTIQYCYYSPIEKKTNVIQLQYIYSWMIPLWNTFKCFSDTIVIFMTHNRYTVVSKIAQFSPAGRLDLPLNSYFQQFSSYFTHCVGRKCVRKE